MEPKSDIAKWFAGKHVFVTGATGFMGKVMIEKLLRCCPDVENIYLFIRHKKGKNPSQRLEDFINSPVFDKLRDQKNFEDLLNKLVCIPGDISADGLALSNDDQATLQDNVSIIFHMAANVRFDQPLKSALLLNTGGTKKLLDLACYFKKLDAFVHVSTTYCHCTETVLEEKVYPAPHNPRKMLDLATWLDDELLTMLTGRLLKDFPNTYAYTKCLTEQLVTEYSKKFPIAISRPSIVTGAWKEPLPGWVDNLNGPTGILVGAGKGVIRSMHCDSELAADIMPVDSTINNIIIIGYRLATSPKSEKVRVYHITNNNDGNRIKWGEVLEIGKRHFYDNPFSVCLWYPNGSIKSSYFLHVLAAFFFHTIPAYLVDFLLIITRNKPFLIRTQKRIEKGLEVLQYYTTRPWYFHNEKMIALSASLSRTDKEIFYAEGPSDYDQYILEFVLGARRYCVHEEPDTIPHARKVLKRLYYLDMVKNIFLIALGVWLFSAYAIYFLNKIPSLNDFFKLFS